MREKEEILNNTSNYNIKKEFYPLHEILKDNHGNIIDNKSLVSLDTADLLKFRAIKIKKKMFNNSRSNNNLKLNTIHQKLTLEEDEDVVYSQKDFIYPRKQIIKLAILNKMILIKEEQIMNILSSFKDFQKAQPVVIISGIKSENSIGFLTSIVRIVRNSDAVLIDSGIKSGLEELCERNSVKLFGVFPEKMVSFPKLEPGYDEENVQTGGHTHLVMINSNNNGKEYDKWGSESLVKFQFAQGISVGSQERRNSWDKFFGPCKKIQICFGNSDNCINDILEAGQMGLVVIVVSGSTLTNNIIRYIRQKKTFNNNKIEKIIDNGHFYIQDNEKTQEMAGFLQFFQTISPF